MVKQELMVYKVDERQVTRTQSTSIFRVCFMLGSIHDEYFIEFPRCKEIALYFTESIERLKRWNHNIFSSFRVFCFVYCVCVGHSI